MWRRASDQPHGRLCGVFLRSCREQRRRNLRAYSSELAVTVWSEALLGAKWFVAVASSASHDFGVQAPVYSLFPLVIGHSRILSRQPPFMSCHFCRLRTVQ